MLQVNNHSLSPFEGEVEAMAQIHSHFHKKPETESQQYTTLASIQIPAGTPRRRSSGSCNIFSSHHVGPPAKTALPSSSWTMSPRRQTNGFAQHPERGAGGTSSALIADLGDSKMTDESAISSPKVKEENTDATETESPSSCKQQSAAETLLRISSGGDTSGTPTATVSGAQTPRASHMSDLFKLADAASSSTPRADETPSSTPRASPTPKRARDPDDEQEKSLKREDSSKLAPTSSGQPNRTKRFRTLEKCQKCNLEFRGKDNLRVHERSKHGLHGGPESYECIFCSKMFKTKFNRNTHHNKHAGIRPHRCKLCGDTFQQRANIKRHMEKRHNVKCPSCSEVFRDANDLPSHYELKHPGQEAPKTNTNFKCDCGATVPTNVKLVEHQDTCEQIAENRRALAEFNKDPQKSRARKPLCRSVSTPLTATLGGAANGTTRSSTAANGATGGPEAERAASIPMRPSLLHHQVISSSCSSASTRRRTLSGSADAMDDGASSRQRQVGNGQSSLRAKKNAPLPVIELPPLPLLPSNLITAGGAPSLDLASIMRQHGFPQHFNSDAKGLNLELELAKQIAERTNAQNAHNQSILLAAASQSGMVDIERLTNGAWLLPKREHEIVRASVLPDVSPKLHTVDVKPRHDLWPKRQSVDSRNEYAEAHSSKQAFRMKKEVKKEALARPDKRAKLSSDSPPRKSRWPVASNSKEPSRSFDCAPPNLCLVKPPPEERSATPPPPPPPAVFTFVYPAMTDEGSGIPSQKQLEDVVACIRSSDVSPVNVPSNGKCDRPASASAKFQSSPPEVSHRPSFSGQPPGDTFARNAHDNRDHPMDEGEDVDVECDVADVPRPVLKPSNSLVENFSRSLGFGSPTVAAESCPSSPVPDMRNVRPPPPQDHGGAFGVIGGS